MTYFKNTTLILIIIIIIGAFFRFYKLDWGQGLFTHPDEYHIVISVNQLSFPNQMHPHFFSYGTVTIYLIYFTKTLLENINSVLNSLFIIPTSQFIERQALLNSFLIGRFYSALFSTLTIPLVYFITLTISDKKFALLAAFLTATTAGLIQQAHFATPESNLIFFLFGSLLFLLKFLKNHNSYFLILASVFFGLALGVKVSSIFFAPIILLAIITVSLPSLKKISLLSVLSLGVTMLTFFTVAPFVFFDFPVFRENIDYEGNLAAGNIPVFYTRQFIDTIPVLFQLEKILPYTLGPALLIVGIMGLLTMVFLLIKKFSFPLFIILTSYFLLFIPNAFLFAKWTRFLAPTFPFFAIFASFLLYRLKSLMSLKQLKLPFYILNSIFIILNLIWALAFFSIYQTSDIRVTASSWLETNTPPNSVFLVEGGNMIDLPLQGQGQRISLNLYNLENDKLSRQKVIQALDEADYLLIQSRRVFANHQRLPEQFPKTAFFYDNLFLGKAGFEQIKQFVSYPSLQLGPYKWELPDEGAEETWSVFDHPVIRVFKKTKQLSNIEYTKLLGE